MRPGVAIVGTVVPAPDVAGALVLATPLVAGAADAPPGPAAFLLDGDTVLDTIEYPAGAATGTETWCRLPNGSVDLDVCSPTPSAENAPP